jgi:hypothetical protein
MATPATVVAPRTGVRQLEVHAKATAAKNDEGFKGVSKTVCRKALWSRWQGRGEGLHCAPQELLGLSLPRTLSVKTHDTVVARNAVYGVAFELRPASAGQRHEKRMGKCARRWGWRDCGLVDLGGAELERARQRLPQLRRPVPQRARSQGAGLALTLALEIAGVPGHGVQVVPKVGRHGFGRLQAHGVPGGLHASDAARVRRVSLPGWP